MFPIFAYLILVRFLRMEKSKNLICYDVLLKKSNLSKMASTKTNKIKKWTPLLNLWTFRVEILFRAKDQSCQLGKVSHQNLCPFFNFVCFSGCHFTQPGFTEKDNVQKFFFDSLHFCLTFLHHISKNWRPLIFLRISRHFRKVCIKYYLNFK